jgi:hypothetical protein
VDERSLEIFMRNLIALSIALLSLAGLSPSLNAASEKCHIGDASRCLTTPGCHWDYSKRGCYEGQAPAQDACAAHEDPNICNTNKTLNCGWNEEAKKCQTKSG